MRPSTLAQLLLAASCTTLAYTKKNDAVKLSQVRTLTLRNNAKTSHRRVSAIPQLKCVGGDARGKYEVDVMRCTNSGSEYDAEDVQWTCKASLPPEFKLGSTDVICEGYDSPDDPYILKGSCGVEYRLMLTPEGKARYGSQRAWRSKSDSYSDSNGDTDTVATVIFWLFFLFVVGVIIYSVWTGAANNGRRGNAGRRTGFGGWGGGGGDDGHDDPPPPYTPRAQPRAKKTTSTPRSSGNNEPWRPGFWTGTAAGAAAGYAANAFANRNNRTRYEDPQPGPSNWFGGGRRQTDWGAEPQPSGWFGGSNTRGYGGGGGSSWGGGGGSSSPSSSRHESTGFGGTRRR